MKDYKEITFGFGNIETAVEDLKSHDELVCGSFNGTMLYSDTDNVDSAYLKITGKTKAEHDAIEQKHRDDFRKEEEEHKKRIPALTEEWIVKGKAVLDEKYHELWTQCVPIRLGDLYRGMELGCCLDIVAPLNAGETLECAKSIIEEQGHSGMSFGLVRSMVSSFCDRGREFAEFISSNA